MTKRERIARQAASDMAKIRAILRHIKAVHENCLLLGERLIEQGQFSFGRQLIALSFKHDLSKFEGIEWDEMAPGTPTESEQSKFKLKLAVSQHNRTNPHHPEHWNSIHDMPDLYLAELACDWKARSDAFSKTVLDYLNGAAQTRYKFMEKDPVYTKILNYLNLLSEHAFTKI